MNNKNINELLNNAAAFENKSALWSEDELLGLLKNAPVSSQSLPPPSRVQPRTIGWRKIMFGSTILAGAAASLLWLLSVNTSQQNISAVTSKAPLSQLSTQQSIPPNTSQEHEYAATTPSSSEERTTFKTENNANLAESGRITSPAVVEDAIQSNAFTSAQTKDAIKVPSKIKGIAALQLSADELSTLGIEQKANSYEVLSELGYNSSNTSPLNAFIGNQNTQQTQQRTQVTLHQENLGNALKPLGYNANGDTSVIKFRVRMDELDIRSVPAPAKEETKAEVYPLIITHESVDENGSEASKALLFGNVNSSAGMNPHYSDEIASLFSLYYPASEKKEQDISRFPLLSKLIPVQLTLGDAQKGGATILLWYYPSEEFINALPPRYAEKIRKEINAIEKFEEKHEQDSTHSLLEQRFSGDYSYTDVARARNGAMEILSIGPNPASERASIRFKLYDERNVSVVIYDMSGAKVAVLNSLYGLVRGESTAELQLGNLASGAYLLSLVSDRNEQAIQRLIIQH